KTGARSFVLDWISSIVESGDYPSARAAYGRILAHLRKTVKAGTTGWGEASGHADPSFSRQMAERAQALREQDLGNFVKIGKLFGFHTPYRKGRPHHFSDLLKSKSKREQFFEILKQTELNIAGNALLSRQIRVRVGANEETVPLYVALSRA